MRSAMLCPLVCAFLILTDVGHAAPTPEGSDAKISDYVKALKSKNASVRKQVAVALGEMGDKAKSAVPALREALLDGDEEVQAAVATALEKINRPEKAGAEADAERKKLLAEIAKLRELAEVERAEAEKLKAEMNVLVKSVREKDDMRAKLLREREVLTNEKVAAAIEAKVLQERTEGLLRQVEELSKELARFRKEQPPARPKPNPPPKDVEGTVTSVSDDLVSISVGSDAGLEKGHTLEVYRIKPTPTYLGQLRIVDVRPKEAVGQFVGKPKSPIEKGDLVGSDLLPREKK